MPKIRGTHPGVGFLDDRYVNIIGDTMTGDLLIVTATDSVTALQIQESGGTPVFTVDTINAEVDVAGDLDVSGDLDVAGHAAFGTDATVHVARIVRLDESFTATTGILYGLMAELTLDPSGVLAAATGIHGTNIQAEWNSTEDGSAFGYVYGNVTRVRSMNSGALDELVGDYVRARHYGSSTLNTMVAHWSVLDNNDGEGAETGNITDAYNYKADASTDKGTGAIVNRYGLYVSDTTGGGILTNQYGIYIESIDAAATLNYVIYTNTGIIHVGDKIEFTQTDGNEYIDSLNDGYMDYGATTQHRFIGPSVRVQGDLYVGNDAHDDPIIVMSGDHNDGQITYFEDEDTFLFSTHVRVAAAFHGYGGFEDQAETISVASGVWTHITNVGNNLWNLDEGDGVSVASDVFTIANTGDYVGVLSLSISAVNARDFHVRIYNNTQTRVEGRPIGVSTTGTGNEMNVCIPIYIEATAGDAIQFEIMNAIGTDPTVDDALFIITYVHD